MVEMHEAVPGKRFDRYHELGQHAFGDKLGLWLIVPQQVMVQAGCDIVYMVTGGSSLMKFYSIVCPDCKPIKLSYFIMMFASIQFILSILPNLTSITGVSFAAAVMSLSVIDGRNLCWFGLSSLGHNIVLEIQASIPSTPDKPSKTPMWKGCYLPTPSRMLRIVTRYFYVAITMFIGIAFPFFGSLLSVLGGIAFAPTSFYLFIIFGMSLTILAPIGAVREIVVQANTFKFFS
ncbi:Lysine histidine transporter 1 [Bienertia sinuspersici]